MLFKTNEAYMSSFLLVLKTVALLFPNKVFFFFSNESWLRKRTRQHSPGAWCRPLASPLVFLLESGHFIEKKRAEKALCGEFPHRRSLYFGHSVCCSGCVVLPQVPRL